MSILRWPQLVRPTAFCFLVKAVQSGLSILSGLAGVIVMILALRSRGFTPLNTGIGVVEAVLIPTTVLNMIVSLSFLLFYLYLGRRAWRIDQEFRRLAASPGQSLAVPWRRRSIGGLAWIAAIAFAVYIFVWESGILVQQLLNRNVSPRPALRSSGR